MINIIKFLKRFWGVLGKNTLIAVLLAVGSTYLSLQRGWIIDFPLTIVGIAVVFPIVFSINGAYKRREMALRQYGIMKSNGRSIYFASRDYIRTDSKLAKIQETEFIKILAKVFDYCNKLFKSKSRFASVEENIIYESFSELSILIEGLRDKGLSSGEVARVHGYLNGYMTAFETIKHIYQYRTPRTLRVYSQVFIYLTLVVLGPYFALIGEESEIWLSLSIPFIFALVFTALDNIQETLENPFDGIGEDDVRINSNKFAELLEEKNPNKPDFA